jgi:hypothetical protein
MGLRAGVADLCLVMQGRAHFLELKSDQGKQSPEQKAFEASAKDAGVAYAVANSVDAALNVLADWGALRHRGRS